MEAWLIYCLREDSPFFDDDALEETKLNHSAMAKQGRDPAFQLRRDGRETGLRDWAREILDKVLIIAGEIDSQDKGDCYTQAVQMMSGLVDDPAATPSARLLDELQNSGSSFFEYAISMARGYSDYFAAITPMSAQRHEEFIQEAADSVRRQHEIEASDSISFEEYLANYYAAQ